MRDAARCERAIAIITRKRSLSLKSDRCRDANIVTMRPARRRFIEVECLYTHRIRGVSFVRVLVRAASRRVANATHPPDESASCISGTRMHRVRGLRLSSCLPPTRRTPEAFSRRPPGFSYPITLPHDSLAGAGVAETRR